MSGLPARSPHPIRRYVERVASKDIEEYPQWDLKKRLPKLPVPELSSTLEQFLRSIKPIVSEDQYEKTKVLVQEFGRPGGEGEKLQKMLKDFAEQEENWAYMFWLNDMYMNARLPLPINSNVGMVFPRQTFADRGDQLRFAARLISGTLDYKVIIDSRSLPTDRARHSEKGQPLCMEQYYRLFTTYREPGIDRDRLVSHADKNEGQMPQHIIVVCKNQYFVLDVVVDGARLSDDNIYTQLKRIVAMAEDGARTADKVGILTAASRTTWAKARQRLVEVDECNRESLQKIEDCIFVLCLDKAIPVEFNHQWSCDETQNNLRDDTSLALQMLHGFGADVNSANRWYDKTMQFVIGADGACGLNYEHSPSEGIAVVQLIEHLLKYMEEIRQRKLPRLMTMREVPYPQQLKFRITDDLKQEIDSSIQHMHKMIDSLDLYVLKFNEFGKEFPKSQNMSPDVFIQLALQLTYYKIYNHLVSTYESASIRRFRLGRVDNIRACSIEALEWCQAMVGEVSVSNEEKMRLFRAAIKQQTDILLRTILGHGMDNHLLGLKQIAVDKNLPVPQLFTDEAYRRVHHFTLSTSQVPTTGESFMCYGPVVPDGYGVCYNPKPHYMLIAITSFKTCGETRSDYFASTLESSFMQMKELCLSSQANGNVNGIKNGTSHKE